jgi:iron(III) transport system ATP-binding protein
VNTVFQHYALFPHMDVAQNVGYGLRQKGVRKDEERRRVAEALELVRLSGYANRRTWEMSGGQQQRVALARALVAEPRVILFVEPLSNLDAKLREETRKELRAFLEKLQITAVYVTHDRVEALALSDTIAVMRAGSIVEIGSPKKIYFDADHRFVADFIGRANLLKARVRGEQGGHTVVECPLGTIACQRRDFPAGGEATLCLRPEFIHLVRGEAPAGHNIVNARIEALTFVGENYETEIRVGGELLLARVEPDANIAVGDAVSFSLDPAHCLLVAA